MSSDSAPQSRSSSHSNKSPSPERPRLTEAEKKTNHIASEQKRRAAIREQFDRIAKMTPGMEGQGRSEGKVLEEMLKFANAQLREREQLIKAIEEMGGVVEPGDRTTSS
jgi:septum formation protein